MPGESGTMIWNGWFSKHDLMALCEFPDEVWGQPWDPNDADRKAAWDLYTEMRTRISTQPLPYRSGDEATALRSIYRLFGVSRQLLRRHGPDCRHFATIAVEVLNVKIRPFTTRWHKLSEAGLLDSEDGRHRFRGELEELQVLLRLFLHFLGRLAEGDDYREGTESGFRTVSEARLSLGEAIPFDTLLGLPSNADPESDRNKMLAAEREEIVARRRQAKLGEGTDDLVGLAISGGGIRSATFALGVLQGIAAKGLLKEVDLLSTVSGGGYLGSFLSSYLNDAETPEKSRRDVGLDPDRLPFRRSKSCESGPMRFLRNHSKFLLPRGFLGRLAMVAQGMYGVLMNLLILAPLLTGAVWLTQFRYADDMQGIATAVSQDGSFAFHWSNFLLTLWVAAFFGLVVSVLPLAQKLSRGSNNYSSERTLYETICVVLFGIVLTVALVQAIPFGYYAFLKFNTTLGLIDPENHDFNPATALVVLGNVATFLSARGLLSRAKDTDAGGAQRVSVIRKLAFLLLWLTGPLLLVMLYFFLCHELLVHDHLIAEGFLRDLLLAGLFVIPLIYTFALLDINMISPH